VILESITYHQLQKGTIMKKLTTFIIFMSICAAAVSVSIAQIPNAGFETWSGGLPTAWITDNVPPLLAPITQSSDAHSGTSAMQGATISYLGVLIEPAAYCQFPVSVRYGSLKGWYKFTPVGGDSLYIHTIFFSKNTPFAYAIFIAGGTVSTYTQFTAPLTYISSAVPDSAYIEISIKPPGSTYSLGTTYKLDDLSYGPATGVQEPLSSQPGVFALSQNYPNPFNPTTVISFQVPVVSNVSLKIFDVMGRKVTTLVSGTLPSGTYSRQWNAQNMPGGVYFYRFQAGSFTETKKLVLLK
jgi:hypothetical protein